MKYFSIPNHSRSYQYILDAFGDDGWMASEKVDGSNLRFAFEDGVLVSVSGRNVKFADIVEGEVVYTKQNRPKYNFPSVINSDIFIDSMKELGDKYKAKNFTVYGEIFGLSDGSTSFTIFGFLNKDDKLNYFYKPITSKDSDVGVKVVAYGKLSELIKTDLSKYKPSHKSEESIFEGLVLTKESGFYFNNELKNQGEADGLKMPFPILKYKTDEYNEYKKTPSNNKVVQSELSAADLELISMITTGRLHNVLSGNYIELRSKSQIGSIIPLMYEDIKKEFDYITYPDYIVKPDNRFNREIVSVVISKLKDK